MRFLGLEIRKAAPPAASAVSSSRGWYPLVREPFSGAWQRNLEWSADTVLAHHAVYACVTLIANDIGKLRPRLVQQDANGIWTEVTSPAFSPVLRKPNRYQNRIQFIQWWITSKLLRGNTYVLKQRDERGVVVALYVLDPASVTVLVAPDGAVYYELRRNDLTGIVGEGVTVPSREIIHDRMNCLFHPLVGVSPIFASGVAANLGLRIQSNSTDFFGNGSSPSGILSSPAPITAQKSKELSEIWRTQYTGANSGAVAVLGDSMTYTQLRMSATDSQMIEHLKWTAETICSTFHVPPWKAHIGEQPAYTKPEIANQVYYSDCLQSLIEEYELCMDEGLGLDEPKDGRLLGVELDLDGLLRMDEASHIDTMVRAAGGAVMTPDEARLRLNKGPLPGGGTLWRQQQDVPIEVAFENAHNPPAPPVPPDPDPEPDPEPEPDDSAPDDGVETRALVSLFRKALAA